MLLNCSGAIPLAMCRQKLWISHSITVCLALASTKSQSRKRMKTQNCNQNLWLLWHFLMSGGGLHVIHDWIFGEHNGRHRLQFAWQRWQLRKRRESFEQSRSWIYLNVEWTNDGMRNRKTWRLLVSLLGRSFVRASFTYTNKMSMSACEGNNSKIQNSIHKDLPLKAIFLDCLQCCQELCESMTLWISSLRPSTSSTLTSLLLISSLDRAVPIDGHLPTKTFAKRCQNWKDQKMPVATQREAASRIWGQGWWEILSCPANTQAYRGFECRILECNWRNFNTEAVSMFRQQGREPLESKGIQMLLFLTSSPRQQSKRWGSQAHSFLNIKIG